MKGNKYKTISQFFFFPQHKQNPSCSLWKPPKSPAPLSPGSLCNCCFSMTPRCGLALLCLPGYDLPTCPITELSSFWLCLIETKSLLLWIPPKWQNLWFFFFTKDLTYTHRVKSFVKKKNFNFNAQALRAVQSLSLHWMMNPICWLQVCCTWSLLQVHD